MRWPRAGSSCATGCTARPLYPFAASASRCRLRLLPHLPLGLENKEPATAEAGRAKLATGDARARRHGGCLARNRAARYHGIKIDGRPKRNHSTNGRCSVPYVSCASTFG
jgi:hypothetical protein